MKNHLFRPLFVAAAFIAIILVARYILVPSDFGVHGDSFTYNFYRADNVREWSLFPVSYRGREYCADCHEENSESIVQSQHKTIECENCHGPAINHPDNPETLNIDRNRKLCLRCHANLPYPGSLRNEIAAIEPSEHNLGVECVECHNPHNPNLEDM